MAHLRWLAKKVDRPSIVRKTTPATGPYREPVGSEGRWAGNEVQVRG